MSSISLPKMVGSPECTVMNAGQNVVVDMDVEKPPTRVDEEAKVERLSFVMEPAAVDVMLNGLRKIKTHLDTA